MKTEEMRTHANHLLHLGNQRRQIQHDGNTDDIPQPRTPIPKPRSKTKEVSIERSRDREVSDEEDDEIVVSETTIIVKEEVQN